MVHGVPVLGTHHFHGLQGNFDLASYACNKVISKYQNLIDSARRRRQFPGTNDALNGHLKTCGAQHKTPNPNSVDRDQVRLTATRVRRGYMPTH